MKPEVLLELFQKNLTQRCNVKRGHHVIVGLSQGADSTALTLLLEKATRWLGLRLTAVTVDHGLRAEAVAEAESAKRLCERWEIEHHTVTVDVAAAAQRRGLGVEEAARSERLAALEAVRLSQGADWIALGHTKTDQAETMLARLRRGTGLTGVSCMRPRRGAIIRPLLEARREDLRGYLREAGVEWCEDRTNEDQWFERARLRRQLLPEVDVDQAAEMAEVASSVNERLGRWEEAWLARCGASVCDGDLFFSHELSAAPAPLSARALRRVIGRQFEGPTPLTREATGELIALARGRGGRQRRWTGVEAQRLGGRPGALLLGAVGRPGGGRVVIAGRGRYRHSGLRLTVAVGRRPTSPMWGRGPAEGAFEVRGRLPGDKMVLNGRGMKRQWDELGLWAPLRDWVPLVVQDTMVLWTGAQPLRVGEGEVVSFELDRRHPLMTWLRLRRGARWAAAGQDHFFDAKCGT